MDAFLNYIEYYLPENRLTNEMISKEHPEWSPEKISAKTGIYSRPIANHDIFASDLAIEAGRKVYAASKINPGTTDFLLYCTQSPDYFLPTTACILQEKIGLPNMSGALDINLGCSGYVYGLSLAKGLIVSGIIKNLLFITSETYSKFIHPEDKGNKTLFGDGASATIISNEPAGDLNAKILDFVFYTDGKGFDKLIVKNGGIRFRKNIGVDIKNEDGSFLKNDSYLYMDGKAIFEFTSFVVPPLVEKALEKNNLKKNDIDLFVFHQANAYMMQFVRKKCQIPEEKFFIFLKDCGNTVSSTIPIALKEAYKQKKIQSGMKIMLAGFGVGLSAAIGIMEVV
ncbi:MAG: 3-oxoacyl-ACP synthase III family protein [Bacteroidales bacterium]